MIQKFRGGIPLILVLVLLLVRPAAAQSSTQPDPPDPLLAAVSAPGPLVLHLPGIGGPRMCDDHMLLGLEDGGVKANIVICDWTENNPGIAALQGYARNHHEAERIAGLIAAHAAADPGSAIYLTGHSGGSGLAVWALEKLPADVKVRTMFLIAPALSPGYDLSKALHHVEGKVYVFSSTLDTVVLGTGTRLFGTIDGVQTAAAGYGGFVRPATAEAAMYQKIVPCPYQGDWVKYGDYGDHIGAMSRRFSKAIMAPLILAEAAPATQPSEAIRASVSH